MRLSKQHGGSRGNDGAKRYFCLCVEGRGIRAELCAERKDPMKSKESAMQEKRPEDEKGGGLFLHRDGGGDVEFGQAQACSEAE